MKRAKKRTEMPLFLLCAIASVYGAVLVWSAAGSALTQVISLLGGLMAALLVSAVDYRTIARRWYIPTAAALLLIGLTFTPLGYTVPGTDDRNWLYLSVAGQSLLFQPSELLKIVFILTFSAHLARVEDDLQHPLTLLLVILHGAVPAVLVAAQGDDGNAVVLLIVCAALLFVAGVRRRYLALACGLIAAAVPLIWRVMPEDKRARFLCLIYVDAYRDTAGWQQDVAVTAIGSGRLWGVGFGEGGVHGLYARHNDFIFTVAGEELGFPGALAVLLLLLLIMLCLYRTAHRSTDRLGRLLCFGMLSLIGGQAVINIGMALRLFPVLGITLPFFSAGGSSLLTLFFGIGLCMSVQRSTA